MATVVGSLLRASTRGPDEPFNILTCPTHERYETCLARSNATFYALRSEAVKDWDRRHAAVPPNYILLNPERGQEQLPDDVDFDLVLSQNRFGQYQILSHVAKQLHLPLVCLEHTLPDPRWSPAQLQSCRQMKGDVNVFISEFSRKEWGWGDEEAEVIHHGVDTELFSPAERIVPKKNHALSVVNGWINRDWCCGFKLWQGIVQDDIPVVVVGNTPGLSQAAKDVHELVWRYREADVFLNTSTVSPIPSALLEAMSCGLAVVSTATAMIPDIIDDGVNGFCSNDPEVLRSRVQELLSNAELRQMMGRRARETVLQRFSMECFTNRWNDVFQRASNLIFRG